MVRVNFWEKLERPIIALSPMDGVTDAPYRFITAKYGKPDVHFTEFANVEGLARNAFCILDDFLYSEIERPVVAQIYGSETESFYKIAIIVCELGFDGIDLNMGCPVRKIASRGCGAGLIRNPSLAKKIIRSVKKGIRDWVDGKSVEDLGLKQKMVRKVRGMNLERTGREKVLERKILPVSIKTRLGYDKVVIEDWIKYLLEEEPDCISIHGRTLKQMYSGQADWEAIARAVEVVHQTPSLVLGNGDITTHRDMVEKIYASGVDGVLLGRGTMGNPWIFQSKEKVRDSVRRGRSWEEGEPQIDPVTRFSVLMEHARYFEEIKGKHRFACMRKHFGWYCKGMPKAAELRNRMCRTNDSEEVEGILADYRREFPDVFHNTRIP